MGGEEFFKEKSRANPRRTSDPTEAIIPSNCDSSIETHSKFLELMYPEKKDDGNKDRRGKNRG